MRRTFLFVGLLAIAATAAAQFKVPDGITPPETGYVSCNDSRIVCIVSLDTWTIALDALRGAQQEADGLRQQLYHAKERVKELEAAEKRPKCAELVPDRRTFFKEIRGPP